MAEIQGLSHVPARLASCDKAFKKKKKLKNMFKILNFGLVWRPQLKYGGRNFWGVPGPFGAHVPTWLTEIEISSMWSQVGRTN